jgi:hypothetical protein
MAGVELDVAYELTGPRGIRAVFNDQADPDYVGVLTNVTGTDAPDLTESAENIVQEDGGIHGDFFYNRRPIVLEGLILNPVDAVDRNVKMEKISAAADAMRGDAVLRWTPSGGERRAVAVRRQNGPRFAGAWQKTFQVALVADDPRIYSETIYGVELAATAGGVAAGRTYPETFPTAYGGGVQAGQVNVENEGNTLTYPILRVFGTGTTPTITNNTTGQSITLNTSIAAGDYVLIDTNPIRRQILLNGTTSVYSVLDFGTSSWWGLVPGINDIRFSFTSFLTDALLAVDWRNAWI